MLNVEQLLCRLQVWHLGHKRDSNQPLSTVPSGWSEGRVQGAHEDQSCLSQVKLLKPMFTQVVACKVLSADQTYHLKMKNSKR